MQLILSYLVLLVLEKHLSLSFSLQLLSFVHFIQSLFPESLVSDLKNSKIMNVISMALILLKLIFQLFLVMVKCVLALLYLFLLLYVTLFDLVH